MKQTDPANLAMASSKTTKLAKNAIQVKIHCTNISTQKQKNAPIVLELSKTLIIPKFATNALLI